MFTQYTLVLDLTISPLSQCCPDVQVNIRTLLDTANLRKFTGKMFKVFMILTLPIAVAKHGEKMLLVSLKIQMLGLVAGNPVLRVTWWGRNLGEGKSHT